MLYPRVSPKAAKRPQTELRRLPPGVLLRAMPDIARIDGVRIVIHYVEEHGIPHFHGVKAGNRVSIAIQTGEVIVGKLPPSDLKRVLQWAEEHRTELVASWERAQRREGLDRLE